MAVGFGLLQFVTFITHRYDLNDNLIDKYLLVWLLLVPAITILIYFGGQLGSTASLRKLKWPKYFIIGNLIIVFLLGCFLFNGEVKAAEEESEIIELTDEEGKQVIAIVPSLAKVKTVACFQFENLMEDEEQDWLGLAFSELLQNDLDQRPEFYSKSAFSLNDYYNSFGVPSFSIPNVAMQRKIAQKARNDYFTKLSYDKEGSQYLIKGNLFSSRDGKSIIDLYAINEDPFAAIDEIKKQISINIPDALEEVENQVHLPASTLISSNMEALMYFTKSRLAYNIDPNNGIENAIDLAQKAIAADPTCSLCHTDLAVYLYSLGKRDETITHLKKAILVGSSLPERMQFDPKEVLYSVTGSTDKFYKLQELRKEMFPYDFRPYQVLIPIYKSNYGIDSAKVLVNEAIENGNLEKGLLTLYSLQVENEEFKAAEQTLDRFSEEFPDREQDKLRYADIYERQGKVDEDRELLLAEEALDPLNTRIQTRLAFLDFKDLNFDKVNERVDQGISQALSLTDSLNFYWIKSYFYRMNGQVENALSTLASYEKYSLKTAPVISVLETTFSTKMELYLSINEPEKTDVLVEEIAKYAPQKVAIFQCWVYSTALERSYQSSISEEHFEPCRDAYNSYSDGYGEYFDVIDLYNKGDFNNCIEILDEDNDKIKKLFSNKDFLSRVYIKAGKFETAKEIILNEINKKTTDPVYYLLMATVLEKEDKNKSKEYLDIAMKYWSNADESYMPAQRARALADRLSES